MNMLEFLQIAQHSAKCFGTAVDRCDIQYIRLYDCTMARVWFDNKVVIDIEDSPVKIMGYNGGYGKYLITWRDNFNYKLIDEYDEEEWIELTHQRYMELLEKEDHEEYEKIMEDEGV